MEERWKVVEKGWKEVEGEWTEKKKKIKNWKKA